MRSKDKIIQMVALLIIVASFAIIVWSHANPQQPRYPSTPAPTPTPNPPTTPPTHPTPTPRPIFPFFIQKQIKN